MAGRMAVVNDGRILMPYLRRFYLPQTNRFEEIDEPLGEGLMEVSADGSRVAFQSFVGSSGLAQLGTFDAGRDEFQFATEERVHAGPEPEPRGHADRSWRRGVQYRLHAVRRDWATGRRCVLAAVAGRRSPVRVGFLADAGACVRHQRSRSRHSPRWRRSTCRSRPRRWAFRSTANTPSSFPRVRFSSSSPEDRRERIGRTSVVRP